MLLSLVVVEERVHSAGVELTVVESNGQNTKLLSLNRGRSRVRFRNDDVCFGIHIAQADQCFNRACRSLGFVASQSVPITLYNTVFLELPAVRSKRYTRLYLHGGLDHIFADPWSGSASLLICQFLNRLFN